jgi:hypothetical protein
VGGQLGQGAVRERAGAEHGEVAGQHPGDVRDRLPFAEADLVRADRHRMPAELHDRHLGGVAGAGGGLFEDQPGAPATQQRSGRVGVGRALEDDAQVIG